jgi:hypothetical protein
LRSTSRPCGDGRLAPRGREVHLGLKAPETPPGLTLDGDILGLIPGYESPFAGHVNAIVLDTALARLDALYQSGTAPAGLKVTLVDGSLGTFPLL